MTEIKTRLRIAECVRLSGVSKTTFYKKYIGNGLIAVSKDSKGHKYIDRSEFIRVFPDAFEQSEKDKPLRTKSDDSELIELLKSQINQLNSQLNDEKQRNHELTLKLLDAPVQQRKEPEPEPQPVKKKSKFFRVLEALTD